MGLFDVFLSEEKKIKKHQRTVTNRDAQPEDREASARWLAENGSGNALLALVSRFDMALDHQLKNQAEVEMVSDLVAAKGTAAVEPLQTWLRQCKNTAVPLRLLSDLAGRDQAIAVAYELLAKEAARDDFKPDKKKKLLSWLAEVRDPAAIDAVRPFLKDFDEGVRYLASEVIAAQGSDAGRPLLAAVLLDPKEDSNRLKTRLAELFSDRRWPIAVPDGLAVTLPEGYGIRAGFLVKEAR